MNSSQLFAVCVDDDDTNIWVELFTGEREYYGPSADEEDDPIDFPDLDPNWLPRPVEHVPLIAPPAPADVSVATVPTSNLTPPTPLVLSDIEDDDSEADDDPDDAAAPEDEDDPDVLTPEDAAPDAIP